LLERVSREAQGQGDGHDNDPQADSIRAPIHARCSRLEDHRREPVLQGKDAEEFGEGQRVCPPRSGRQADEEGQSSLARDLGLESLRWASDTFGNLVAALGRQLPDQVLAARFQVSKLLDVLLLLALFR